MRYANSSDLLLQKQGTAGCYSGWTTESFESLFLLHRKIFNRKRNAFIDVRKISSGECYIVRTNIDKGQNYVLIGDNSFGKSDVLLSFLD